MASSESADGSNAFEQKSEAFMSWFQSREGARLSSNIKLADLRSQHAGRGAVALEDMSEGQEIFAIPRNLVLTTENSSLPKELLEPLGMAESWLPLIVTLIYEYLRKKESPWYPYLNILPTTFDTLMFWNQAELAQLQGSAVISKIGREDAEEGFKEYIVPIIFAHEHLFPLKGEDKAAKSKEIIELAHIAGSWIMAYAFDIETDDDRKSDTFYNGVAAEEELTPDEPLKGMVPFADMLNADADRNNARLFQEDDYKDYLIMKATKSIKVGAEIFNDYGSLPRSDLLRMYGYITENYAQYDVVEFSFDLLEEMAGKRHDASNKGWVKRKNALDDIGLIEDGYALQRPSIGEKLEDVVPGELHMLLRAMTDHDKIPKDKPKDPITIEEAALLSATLTKRLVDYPTSVDEDSEILSKVTDGDHSQLPDRASPLRFEMAVKVRKGEKEVLQRLIDLSQDHIGEMTNRLASIGEKRKHDNASSSEPNKAAKRGKS